MGLNIYFLDESGEDVEIESYLRITHNLNSVVSELGLLVGLPYYEVIWRPDELFGLKNGAEGSVRDLYCIVSVA